MIQSAEYVLKMPEAERFTLSCNELVSESYNPSEADCNCFQSPMAARSTFPPQSTMPIRLPWNLDWVLKASVRAAAKPTAPLGSTTSCITLVLAVDIWKFCLSLSGNIDAS